MDGSRIRKEKVVDSKLSGYVDGALNVSYWDMSYILVSRIISILFGTNVGLEKKTCKAIIDQVVLKIS